MKNPADGTEEALLGVPHLIDLWSRTAGPGAGAPSPDPARWAADRAAIYGLGLGLRETLALLHGVRPGFDDFLHWILERNGGDIEADRIRRVNEAVASALAGRVAPADPAARSGPLTADDLLFWRENGYVLLKGAVPRAACAAAARAIWDFLGMEPDDAESWYRDSPRDGLWVPLLRHPALDRNRASERIRGAFAQLWGSADLVATIDQSGFNPPERPGRPFQGQGLHWDTSLAPPMPLGIQGILYLTDTPADQGAFRCVPGFHQRIERWLAALPAHADPRQQDLSAEARAVPGKAGDMVIWHSSLPHGASPNRGIRPRLVQYIAYFPPGLADERPWR